MYGEGEEQEKFTYIMALVAFQCAVNYLYALVMGRTVLQQGEDTTRRSYYMLAALTYLVAMVTSNKALAWVNYPTQVAPPPHLLPSTCHMPPRTFHLPPAGDRQVV